MPIDDVGTLNNPWGICGVTSSLYAVYNHSPSSAGIDAKAKDPIWVMNEIKSYLESLKFYGETQLLNDITEFTRCFGDQFKSWSLEKYVNRVLNKSGPGFLPLENAKFSVAMPPHAVIDYLKRRCSFLHAKQVPLTPMAAESIIGVYSNARPSGMYGNLRHYFYQKNGTYYSWGLQYPDLTSALNAKLGYDGVSHQIVLS